MREKKSPAALVLPFGKHRGLTVAEVLANDPGYAEWLTAQGWLAERFAELHAAIASRGKATDDTPEHNAMQAKFLSPSWALACVMAAYPADITEALAVVRESGRYALDERAKRARAAMEWSKESATSVQRRIDQHEPGAVFSLEYYASLLDEARGRLAEKEVEVAAADSALQEFDARPQPRLRCSVRFEVRGVDVEIRGPSFSIGTELKPSLGDDFPGVMRQMERTGASILVVGAYSGAAVPEPSLRKMFAANKRALVFERDIAAELGNARSICAEDAPA